MEIFAHIFRLRIIWSQRAAWDVTLLAKDISQVQLWLSSTGETSEDYIEDIHISLLARNVIQVKESFAATALGKGTLQDVFNDREFKLSLCGLKGV